MAVDEALHRAWVRWCGDLSGIELYRGSILESPCDAVVSPANRFGFIDAGVDRQYTEFFGSVLQERVQERIRELHHGELLVGQAMIVAAGHTTIPYLVVAPTLCVPPAVESVFERTAQVGRGSRAEYERDLSDPKWQKM